MTGIGSFLWWGFSYFTRSASHITNIVGIVLKDLSHGLLHDDSLTSSHQSLPGRILLIEFQDLLSEKFTRNCYICKWNKVLHFLATTCLSHQNCWIFFTGDTILSTITIKHLICGNQKLFSIFCLCVEHRDYTGPYSVPWRTFCYQ